MNKLSTTPQASTRDSVPCDDWLGDGFVFLDNRSTPYMVRMEDKGELWLYYWHADKKWVTLKRIETLKDLWAMKARALRPEQATLYSPNDQDKRTREGGKGGSNA